MAYLGNTPFRYDNIAYLFSGRTGSTLTGLDINGKRLTVYAKNTQVFLNGVLQVEGVNYSVPTSSQIAFIDYSLVASDYVSIICSNIDNTNRISTDLAGKTYVFTGISGATISGTDSNGRLLTGINGTVDVFLNGVMLVEGVDFQTTSPTEIGLLAGVLEPTDHVIVRTFAYQSRFALAKDTKAEENLIVSSTTSNVRPTITFNDNGLSSKFYANGNQLIANTSIAATDFVYDGKSLIGTLDKVARVDIAQAFSNTEQTQIRANIGAFPRAGGTINGSISVDGGIYTAGTIEVGYNRTSDGPGVLDLHAVANTDYDARIIRNSGVNGSWEFINTGNGNTIFRSTGTSLYTFDNAIFSNSTIQATSSFRVASDSNRHLWFQKVDGTVGGLLYNDSTSGVMQLRAYNAAGTSYQTLTLDTNGNVTAQGNLYAGSGTVQAGSTAGTYCHLRFDGSLSKNGGTAYQILTTGDLTLDGVRTFGFNNAVSSGQPYFKHNNGTIVYLSYIGTNNYAYTNLGIQCETGGRIRMTTGNQINFHWNSGFYYNIDGNAYVLINSSASDKNLKENIQPLTNATETVKKLNPVTYNFKDNLPIANPKGNLAGFIAQELQEVMPNLVATSNLPNDDLNKEPETFLRYEDGADKQLIALLVGAVKELSARVEELEKKNG
ncbi:tail fiber protein [Ochrobactrum phage vB_OspM_OC]|nr:tail fiber protein [Ochrobactrum phage vB_OspM_OC]